MPNSGRLYVAINETSKLVMSVMIVSSLNVAGRRIPWQKFMKYDSFQSKILGISNQ